MYLLLLTADPHPSFVLPSLALLSHNLRSAPAEVSSLLDAGTAEVAIVDARTDLAAARALCRLLGSTGTTVPVAVVVPEGGLVAITVEWCCDEILLPNIGPAELDARLRLLVGLRGRPIDLTYKEFELLKYLVRHAGRVFTRRQLLQEVWGYDFFGGTRTVDVHVRRLRAKLGTEYESLIGTVRNVGYKAVRTARDGAASADADMSKDGVIDGSDAFSAAPRGLPDTLVDPP
jgi:DNA-binding winged helix-turn-helix (wHTH) protein